MSPLDIIRAWKDEDYRLSLSDAQRAMLPSSPVGLIELSDLDMSTLAGGGGSHSSSKGGHGYGKTGKHGSCNAKKHTSKYSCS
jgi:mersacidin/lichenicidin family type 2 lantibiotic